MIGQFHGARIDRDTESDAFLKGFTILTRFRLQNEPGSWTPFLEINPGMSWSPTVVPPAGTTFNYLIVAGVGTSRRLGAQTHFTTGFRRFHLSNANLEGPGRNPDIQALGGFATVTVGF